MSDEVALQYRYSEEEYAQAVRLYFDHTLRLEARTDVIACGLAIAAGALCWLFIDRSGASLFLAGAGLFGLMLTGYVTLIVPKQWYRRDPRLQSEYRLVFRDDGIEFKTDQIDSRLEWSLYQRMIENTRFYVLIYGRNMISVIPKRAFSSPEQEDAFRELVKRHLPVS
jgi:hypothetical protein